MSEENFKRHVAYKLKVNEILESEFVKKTGWEPSYILTKKGQVHRTSLIGFVVSKSIGASRSLMVDDGTGTIDVRFFAESMPDVSVGDMILLIGKPRHWNNDKYIASEIIRKIENKDWLKVWQLDSAKSISEKRPIIKEKIDELAESPDKILEIVQKLDPGDGASIDEVIKVSNAKNAEEVINNLLKEGEIYQIGPGKIKMLE